MRRREVLLGGAAAAACAPLRPLLARLADDTRLSFVEAGGGAPMILVHGGLQDYRLWSPIMAALAVDHRVIAYSRRNHYPGATSPRGVPDGAADLHAADLVGLMDFLDIPASHIVAHSAGAHAALFFAHAHPERLSKLAVNEPPAAGLLTDTAEDRAAAQDFAATLAPAREALRAGRFEEGLRLFADAVGGPGEFERRSRAEHQRMRDNIDAHIADAITTRPRPLFTGEMARQIAAPALVITGTRSPAFFHRIADRLASSLSNASRARIEGASHSVPSEAPAVFAQAVLDFVDAS